ncbi:hypothetical protein ACIGB6_00010 [Paeniglutamicibacter gangotriensis]|uniref:Uncharacterized protein n=1 Tax=Paeniglutamicibacter gangotriensis TaxID=254787 RepID=A0A5B0EF36_9MICC|nr:hypothetical protein [Paeniglutamicibacter gangotriensis]KAA0975979.1 hypothetical protein FQ154_13045 [Paeniglutamicibacter gangotriensis]
MTKKLHRVLSGLGRKLESESPAAQDHPMPFPTHGDRSFTRRMTLAQLHAHPTELFDVHAGQPDLPNGPPPGSLLKHPGTKKPSVNTLGRALADGFIRGFPGVCEAPHRRD